MRRKEPRHLNHGRRLGIIRYKPMRESAGESVHPQPKTRRSGKVFRSAIPWERTITSPCSRDLSAYDENMAWFRIAQHIVLA